MGCQRLITASSANAGLPRVLNPPNDLTKLLFSFLWERGQKLAKSTRFDYVTSTEILEDSPLGRRRRQPARRGRAKRYTPGLHHRRDEAKLSRLRHDRDREPGPSRCA